jgi:hypothetical protein
MSISRVNYPGGQYSSNLEGRDSYRHNYAVPISSDPFFGHITAFPILIQADRVGRLYHLGNSPLLRLGAPVISSRKGRVERRVTEYYVLNRIKPFLGLNQL